MDLDDVESHGRVALPMQTEIGLCQPGQSLPFARVDGCTAWPEFTVHPRFYLDEHKGVTLPCHEVDLPETKAEVACYDRHSLSLEPSRGQCFTLLSLVREAFARMPERSRSTWMLVLVTCLLGTTFVSGLSLMGGTIWFGFHDFILIYGGYHHDPMFRQVLEQVRAPRVALALMAGMSLAVSGGVWQGMLRNPLADPYLLGITSGSALGAALSLGLGFTAAVPASAFMGGLLTVLLVLLIAATEGGVERLVLVGLAVSALTSAALGLVTILWPDRVAPLQFWMLGGFSARTWEDVATLWPWVLVGMVSLIVMAPSLNVLQLGDQRAASLGVSVNMSRWALVVATTMLTAATVATCGAIGFVGLMVPQAARLWVGADVRRMLPVAALLGASLVVLADLAGRVVWSGGEIPAGVVTALIGGPCLLVCLSRSRLS